MSVMRALVDHFVVPVGDEGPRPSRRAEPAHGVTAVPPAVGLLCGARRARSAGCALGLHLVRRHRAGAAVVVVWTGEDPRATASAGAPAGREARRLSRALAVREIAARAAGRLAVAELPAAPDEAAQVAAQVLGVGAAVPTVLVLAGPREDPLDALLESRDLVLVAGTGDGLLADVAVEALQRRGVAARRCALPAPQATAMAARGAGLLPAARRGLDAALEGLA
ncbi:MAG: hypothetical protein ACSLFR_01060 [Solirubrobacteraceae bacterium]